MEAPPSGPVPMMEFRTIHYGEPHTFRIYTRVAAEELPQPMKDEAIPSVNGHFILSITPAESRGS
jgi:hypothetical protein